ncbi:hypothetical protein [Streptomyces fagopyri]|uniref:hypothetical protein n=1 Tax=Streptomyces fagopyri TaxID=2662397 RepID=UPI0037180D6E
MNGVLFSFADFEASFGPEGVERTDREAREAPRFTPEQILHGQRLFATFRVPQPKPTEGHRDAEEG